MLVFRGVGILYLLSGLWCALKPELAAEFLGLHFSTSAGKAEFFSVYGRVGETYKNNDVREIVRKWERLLSDPDAYQDQIEAASGKSRKEHSYINQENQYLRAYEKVVLRRDRYLLRKAESASLKP